MRLHLFICFSITLLICFLKIQVALVDLNQSVGEECKSDLDGHFGEDNNIFIQCDVTDAAKLRGNFFFLSFFFFFLGNVYCLL